MGFKSDILSGYKVAVSFTHFSRKSHKTRRGHSNLQNDWSANAIGKFKILLNNKKLHAIRVKKRGISMKASMAMKSNYMSSKRSEKKLSKDSSYDLRIHTPTHNELTSFKVPSVYFKRNPC